MNRGVHVRLTEALRALGPDDACVDVGCRSCGAPAGVECALPDAHDAHLGRVRDALRARGLWEPQR